MKVDRRRWPFKGSKKLSKLQQLELYSWWLAKKELGSFKAKSREMGVSTSLLLSCVYRMRDRSKR